MPHFAISHLSGVTIVLISWTLTRSVAAFSTLSPVGLAPKTSKWSSRYPTAATKLYKKINDDDDDSFYDPHALMEYLDGDDSGGDFVSFEDYLAMQRKQQYLRACPIFRACSDDDLSRIASKMILEQVAPNTKLVVQGETGDAMYFLKSGTLQAIGEPAASNETDATTTTTTPTIYTTYSKEGSFFGELALLFGQTRAASIVSTSEPAQVYRLDKAAFLDSLVDSPVYDTARRLVLAKYKSTRIRDVLPKIRIDEIVGLLKARLLTSKTKNLRLWWGTLRTFALGACATLLVTNNYVKVAALKPLVVASLAVLAHLL